MIRRATIAVTGLATVILAACATQTVEVKPIGSALAEGRQPSNLRVAEGNAQLAMGNVGLAIEAYRKALREEPGNVDALMGMATCYDRMGRPDLSRRNYELALAAKPRDAQIYTQFAQSLQEQGQATEAARVSTEISARSVAPETPPAVPSSVAVLPPPPAPSVASASAPLRMAPVAVPPSAKPAIAGPQLVRVSLAEVALITKPRPVWESRVVAKSAQSATIVFIRHDAPKLTLLNAAKVGGLAARTRAYLQSRGFSRAAIGNDPATRDRSVIRFAGEDQFHAKRIAAQFGFALERQRVGRGGLTILLGRDAARDRALRPSA